MRPNRYQILLVLVVGAALGAAAHSLLSSKLPRAVAQESTSPANLSDVVKEIKSIADKVPDQSHAMQDVSYHFANLWFAGQHENWDLAHFYWSETRSHLRWAARIIPIRKDNAGREVDVQTILQAFENGVLKTLEDSINAKNPTTFDANYRATLEGCYACHKAADKPFLRPQVPEHPETPIINFDPQADWPK
jgi:hypothetical protein